MPNFLKITDHVASLFKETLCETWTQKKNGNLGSNCQAGIKIARRNINNLRYADDTTLMAENEEKLKSLLMKVKEENKKLA